MCGYYSRADTNHAYTVYTTSTVLPLLKAVASNYFEELLPRKCGFYSSAASNNINTVYRNRYLDYAKFRTEKEQFV